VRSRCAFSSAFSSLSFLLLTRAVPLALCRNRLIKTHLSAPSLRLVILHCMRSQTRFVSLPFSASSALTRHRFHHSGPYAAYLLSQFPSLPPHLKVVILEGGYQGWWRKFKGRKDLNENLLDQEASDASGWEDTVNAGEGTITEAEDSRELRRETGKQAS
jgi:hypothetical protein